MSSSKMGITLTFGEVAENHVGMQQIGEKSDNGLSPADLKRFRHLFDRSGFQTEMCNLNMVLPDEYQELSGDQDALVLIIRNGIEFFGVDPDELYMEQECLDHDMKYYDTRRKRVLNKRARYNLCFNQMGQIPDFESGKGTVIAYKQVPNLAKLRHKLSELVVERGHPDLKVEGNYYYDPKKCGIGYHGDTERSIVIAVRLGVSLPLTFVWYHKSKPISERIDFHLNHGDIYFMSEKATGNDWKKRSKATLRHAAGCSKYTKIKS
jgi:alkylated DNA repair dioxygenase AlkB